MYKHYKPGAELLEKVDPILSICEADEGTCHWAALILPLTHPKAAKQSVMKRDMHPGKSTQVSAAGSWADICWKGQSQGHRWHWPHILKVLYA